MLEENFFTFNEYMKKEGGNLTASMEDYLEMIYRLSKDSGFTRIHDLAMALNVQPPSATKMVQKLSELKLVNYEKYSIIILQTEGKQMGRMLLKRHALIEEFLRTIGVTEKVILEETEKIEHTISNETLKSIDDFIEFVKEKPEFISEFANFKLNKNGQREL